MNKLSKFFNNMKQPYSKRFFGDETILFSLGSLDIMKNNEGYRIVDHDRKFCTYTFSCDEFISVMNRNGVVLSSDMKFVSFV